MTAISVRHIKRGLWTFCGRLWGDLIGGADLPACRVCLKVRRSHGEEP